jgi:hypothetical protein
MIAEERLALARELAARLLARHGERAITAVGLHGAPPAIELAVVTADPDVAVPDRALRFGTGDGGEDAVVVEIAAIGEDAYLHEAGQIGPLWPLVSDQYLRQVPLHDPDGFFHKLRHVHEAAISSASDRVFAAAAGYDLVQLIAWEARARAAELAGDLPAALLAAKEGALLAALVAGLLTRTAYRDQANALYTAATDPAIAAHVQGGFAEQFRRLIDPASDPTSAVLALGRVLAALTGAARREGVPFETDDLDAFA